MTKAENLTRMAEVVQAKYEQEQRRFAQLVSQENKLRAELAHLDDMRRATRAPLASLHEMQMIGADVLWQGWVGRSKTALNLQLAQILAQKEHFQNAVRQAYGKVLVVDQMRDAARTERATQTAQSQLQRAVNQALWRQ